MRLVISMSHTCVLCNCIFAFYARLCLEWMNARCAHKSTAFTSYLLLFGFIPYDFSFTIFIQHADAHTRTPSEFPAHTHTHTNVASVDVRVLVALSMESYQGIEQSIRPKKRWTDLCLPSWIYWFWFKSASIPPCYRLCRTEIRPY